ncbi:glutathione S-transferase family protein [Acanthopleuribacter pedis]|uniref:Glutathione S-transferase family protein n=1 Tax=Acanthopleuribacter pedis TaxID=442870 RepID=A0A8J7QFP7_9BACT|nr:glutathione S-transferase family protein [Acanthopleuribacter pedis]MBO1317620.1 glutathione S-transferase family protein [Acanthopleuribacter pedis]
MIELIGLNPTRSNRVQWILEELDLPYRFRQVNFKAGDTHSPAFLALNPNGKIPVLRDGDLVIYESAAIANYLAETYGDGRLMPALGTPERAHYHQWLIYAVSELEQPLWTAAKHKFALPEALRVDGLKPAVKFEFDRAFNILADWLKGREFMIGQNFSCVDVFITHTLGWAQKAGMDMDAPHVAEYVGRMTARPAFSRIAQKESEPFNPA